MGKEYAIEANERTYEKKFIFTQFATLGNISRGVSYTYSGN